VGEPTVLFFGSNEHATLTTLYHHLKERGNRRVVYLAQEQFPQQPAFELQVGPGWEHCTIHPENEAPVEIADLVSVVLDRYSISPPNLETFSPDDQEYIQVESWATLIALFGALSRHCLVANHVLLREHLVSRMAELCYLASFGLAVPRTVVTSVPAHVLSFVDSCGGQAIYRPVSGMGLPFRSWTADDAARVAELKLCPMHFEEAPGGLEAALGIVGQEVFVKPDETDVPPQVLAGCVKACQGLDLWLAEAGLRQTERGWVVTGLRGFPSSDWLGDLEFAEATSALLEGGLPA